MLVSRPAGDQPTFWLTSGQPGWSVCGEAARCEQERRCLVQGGAQLLCGIQQQRLREAYTKRITVESMPDAAIKRASQIAGTAVPPEAMREADEAVQPQAHFGIESVQIINKKNHSATCGFQFPAKGLQPRLPSA